MQYRVCLPNFLQVGVVRGKAVVRTGRAGEQQPHRVAFVAKGRLHANEHVAKGLAVHQQILAVGIELSGRWPPVLF